MTHNKPQQKPKENRQWNDIAQRISAIGQQVSVPLRDLSGQIVSLANQVKSNNQETQRSEKEYRQRSLLWARRNTLISGCSLFFSVLFASATVYILWNQLFVMRTDRRAWLNMSVVGMEIVVGKPLKFVVRVMNSGQTPARRFDSRFVIEKVPSDRPPSFVYDDPDRPYMFNVSGIIIPNAPHQVDVFLTSKQQRSISEPLPLTEADMEELRTGKAYIAIFGEATYFDVYRIPHWIRFCAWHNLASGSFSARACSEYNDVDNN